MATSKFMLATTLLLVFTTCCFCVRPGGISSSSDINGRSAAAAASPPIPSGVFSPDESEEFYKYLRKCATKFTGDCGYRTFSAIVYKNASVSELCCGNIINDLGKCCYESLIIPVLESPYFKGNASDIAESNRELWNRCDEIA